MRIGRIIAPVHSLGPGERICVWVQGCSRACDGCISPELQFKDMPEADNQLLIDLICRSATLNGCDGLTISGGEPFEQSESLLELLRGVRATFQDILVFTGFMLEQLQGGKVSSAAANCLELIDVLVDGPYIKERNLPGCVLRGSDNQRIHFLQPAAKAVYEPYLKQGRTLESFVHNGTVIIVGIPNRRDGK